MVSPDNKCAAKEDSCLEGKLPVSRGILPWKMRPGANFPEGTPLSGDAGEEQSQIGNFDLITLPIEMIELAMNPGQSVQRVELETLSPAELHQLYAGTQVPEHRYLAPSLTMAVHSPEIAPHPAKWIAGIPEIDLAKVANAWLNTNGNTDYEQLYCIGLDRDTGQLSGVLKVKQGSGYSGGPRTAGSIEYVAFWVDWGSGFQYEGTAEVAVYDFGWLPPAGLEYTVSLPVDLLSHLRPCCESAKTVKVRAVLSWNTPPSTRDPNAPVVWGNRVESRIPIPPSQEARAGNQAAHLATAGAAEIDRTGADERIADAAIRAREIDDGGKSFTLYAWKRSSMNRGARSNLNRPSPGFCPQAMS